MTRYLLISTLSMLVIAISLLPTAEGLVPCSKQCNKRCQRLSNHGKTQLAPCVENCKALAQGCLFCPLASRCHKCKKGYRLVKTATGKHGKSCVSTSGNEGLNPTLAYSIPGTANGIVAMALFNDQLFVVRNLKQSSNQVEVYNTTTSKLLRYITVTGATGKLYGLAVSPADNCLYVSDNTNNTVYKVDLTTSSTTSWSVDYPCGLSLNKLRNVLIGTANDSNSIQEWTPSGQLVRNIPDATGSQLWQALELSDGTLVATRWGPISGVFVTSLSGTVLRSYGSAPGSGPGQMNSPGQLAADSQGNLLVADFDNNRILILNPQLTQALPLPLPGIGAISEPNALCFDETRGRLYVGEWSGQNRVLVFDNVYNVGRVFQQSVMNG